MLQVDEKEVIRMSIRDPQQFGVLFDRYYAMIFNYLYRRVRHLQDAQSLASDTFFKALHKLHQFQLESGVFAHWLYRIANNEANMYFRKKKNPIYQFFALSEIEWSLPELAEDMVNFEEAAEKLNTYQAMQSALEKLKIRYQEVLALRYFEDKSIREIAQILGKPEGTIKSLHARGLEKLKIMLKNP